MITFFLLKGYFLYLAAINMVRQKAMASATGVANQIPFTPQIAGNTSMVMIRKTKEREKASTAETSPLEMAVNMALPKILNPTKSSAKEQMRFPVTARS